MQQQFFSSILSPLSSREEIIYNAYSLWTAVTPIPHFLQGKHLPLPDACLQVTTLLHYQIGGQIQLPVWFDRLAVQFKPWRIPNPFMLRRMYPRVWICLYLLHFLQRTRIIGKFLLFLALIQQLLLNKKFTNLKVFPFLQNSHLKVLKYSLHYIVFFFLTLRRKLTWWWWNWEEITYCHL